MGTQRWRWPGVEVDLEQRSVETSEGTESLTAKESGVLRYLLDRPGVTIARDELLREVWKQPRPGRTRAVDHVVRRLRNKLGDDARRPSILFSDYGDGYRIETPRQSRAERTRLPLEPDPLVGRVAELDTIRELLDAHPIVVLTGPGGIGKSRLALRVAHAVGDAHGPVTWIDTSGVRTPEGLAWCVARRLDVPLAPVAPVERLGDTLADGPPRLLVLDGLEQMADVAVDLLAQWRDAAEGARFLITSRVSLPMRAVEQILAPLGKPDARALFEQHASRSLGPGTAAPLLEALGGLPLAIELAATRARERPLADVLNDVTNRPTRLALPGTGPRFPGHRSLVACVEASRGWIGSATWDAWLALGVFEGPVRRDAATHLLAVVCDISAEEALPVLVRARLLTLLEDGYRMAPLLRSLGRELAPNRLRRRAEDALDEWWVAQLEHGAATDQVAAKLETSTDDLLSALRRNLERRALGRIGSLARLLVACLRRRGAVGPHLPLLRQAAESVGPRGGGASLWDTWAWEERIVGNLEESVAIAQQVLSEPETGGPKGRAQRAGIRARLAWTLRDLGRLEDARIQLETAEREIDAVLEHPGAPMSARRVGLATSATIHEVAGDLAAARDVAEEFLRLADHEDRVAWAHVLVARVLRREGRAAQARIHLDRAIAHGTREGNSVEIMNAWRVRGVLELSLGDVPAAERAVRQAAAINRCIGSELSRLNDQYNLATLATARGDTPGAQARVERAVENARAIGARAVYGRLETERCRLFGLQGRWEAAARAATEAWRALDGRTEDRARLLEVCLTVALRRGDVAGGSALVESRRGELEIPAWAPAEIARLEGRVDDARAIAAAAVARAREEGPPVARARALEVWSRLRAQCEPEAGVAALAEAAAAWAQLGRVVDAARCRAWSLWVAGRLGHDLDAAVVAQTGETLDRAEAMPERVVWLVAKAAALERVGDRHEASLFHTRAQLLCDSLAFLPGAEVVRVVEGAPGPATEPS